MSFRSQFVDGLPSNPDDALIVLADRAAEWLQAPEQPDDSVNSAYILQIFDRFVGRYRPELKEELPENPDIRNYVQAIIKFAGAREVDRLLDSYERTVEDSESFGVASLTPTEKEKLHEHLVNLRKLIEASDIPPRKKNALYSRLNALAAEIDSSGTRTDRFFSFAGDVAFVIGDMTNKAKPFIDEVKEVLKIIRGSRARTENVKLPHDDTLSLPAPDDHVPTGSE